jgi:hypothetical protein
MDTSTASKPIKCIYCRGKATVFVKRRELYPEDAGYYEFCYPHWYALDHSNWHEPVTYEEWLVAQVMDA